MTDWKIAGTIKASLQAEEEGTLKYVMREKTRGMINWVAPEPTLAHPAAIPLARPTMEGENMELIQNWQDTKLAREKPTRKRMIMKD